MKNAEITVVEAFEPEQKQQAQITVNIEKFIKDSNGEWYIQFSYPIGIDPADRFAFTGAPVSLRATNIVSATMFQVLTLAPNENSDIMLLGCQLGVKP